MGISPSQPGCPSSARCVCPGHTIPKLHWHHTPCLECSSACPQRKGALELSSRALGAPSGVLSPEQEHGADEGSPSLLSLPQVRLCSLLALPSVEV